MRFVRFWRSILAASGWIYSAGVQLLDWSGRYDTYLVHRAEPGWMGTVLDYILHPSIFAIWFIVPVGLVLIWWDAHRKMKMVRLAKVTRWPTSSAPVQAIQQPRSEPMSRTINLDAYSQKVFFDYSTYSGHIEVNKSNILFDLYFSKASNTRIHICAKRHNALAVARIKSPALGQKIKFDKLDSTSDYYSVSIGDNFIVQNSMGKFLLGKVLSLKDDTLGDANDEICFAYEFDSSGIGQFTAL